MPVKLSDIEQACAYALIQASTVFSPERVKAYQRAIELETEDNAKWLLEMTLENSVIAEKKRLPLCDDTGIPYVLIEAGRSAEINGNVAEIIEAVNAGIAAGLRSLPGRPMAVKGDYRQRVDQSAGLHDDSGMLEPSPLRFKAVDGSNVKINVLMLGGGPEIRSRTYRVFHKHDFSLFAEEIASWAVEMAALLGCTPCVPAIGVGRTHYEASCLMLDAMIHGVFGEQSEFEEYITDEVNKSFTGTLGIGGKITALQTFAAFGPQRASGVRIVCLRTGCCVEPRKGQVVITA